MTDSHEQVGAKRWNGWRIARWTGAAVLLLTPLVMMQVSPDWHWTIGDFLFAGCILGGIGLLYDLAERASGNRAYRIGAAIALVAGLLTVWTTLVRDDGNGMHFFLIVMAAIVGSFAAWFQPAGMARTMVGVAMMQALLGLALATAPSVAEVPGASLHYAIASGVFAALWLASAAFYRTAATDT